MAAEKRAVDPAAEVAFGRERRGVREVRRADEAEEQPRADQQRDGDSGPRRAPEPEVQERGDRPRQADELQDAEDAHVGEVKLEELVVDEAEEDQRQPAAHRVPRERGLRRALRKPLRRREREARARDEEEEREDQVLEREPGPGDVAELPGERAVRRAESRAEGDYERPAAHDEEHVEAAQGVKRQETGAFLVRCHFHSAVL